MNNLRPEISIIIPLYNQGEFLEDCIKSIYESEDAPTFEVIVIDDCSTDDSFSTAFLLSMKYNFRLLKNSQNKGLCKTRNFGFRESKGKRVLFLDADDYIKPSKLRKQCTDSPVSVADFAFQTDIYIPHKIGLDLADPRRDFMTRWEKGLTIAMHSFVFKREVLEDVGLFDESLPNHEDWDLHLRWSEKYQPAYIPEVLSVYRIHDKSMCRTTDQEAGKRMVEEKHGIQER